MYIVTYYLYGVQGLCTFQSVVHAEANAIMHKTCIDLKGCSIYTTLFPCNECAKLIIQSGITKVYYLSTPGPKPWMEASQSLLSTAGYTVTMPTDHARELLDQQPPPAEGAHNGVEKLVQLNKQLILRHLVYYRTTTNKE